LVISIKALDLNDLNFVVNSIFETCVSNFAFASE
jgi:hypothetical protein